MSRLSGLLPLITLLACTKAPADSDTSTAVDTNTGTDSGAAADTTFELQHREFASHAPIADTPVTVNDQSYTSDANGSVFIVQPSGTPLLVEMSAEGFPPYRGYRLQPEADVFGPADIPSNATLAALSAALGITIDPAKAVIVVTTFEPGSAPGSTNHLADVRVDLDAAYDLALVADSNSPYGFSPGNTTLAGSPADVVFVNVDAGALIATLTAPEGRVCANGWSSLEAEAGAFLNTAYFCPPAR